MYIEKYWGDFIGGSDDSLNLIEFLEDCRKEEITLTEIFIKIGLDKQNWDFRKTENPLEFRHSIGVDMDFHFAIDVIIDLAAILLECHINESVKLHDLSDNEDISSLQIRVSATDEEHSSMNHALMHFTQNPKSYDLYEMIGDDIVELAMVVEEMRKELYE